MNGPSRITVLPPELASQIAAGEVVERPASVVKELVENALDAGARSVEVEVEGGGLSLLRVTDDGLGMTPEEARLCVERHATSKLRCAEDLFAISTMGFRGEALPSIAAVSRMTITTRTAAALGAFRLGLEGGQVTGPGREAGARVGTQVEVRDLFYNVPARLKFVKGDATEAGHIAEALLRLALAFPEVHFKLRQNGRVTLDLPPHPGGLERAQAALLARGHTRPSAAGGTATLHPAAGSEAGIDVAAYLGSPEDSTATPRNVFLLVNRRFVRDRSLLHAVTMAYGEVVEKGRYPLTVLDLRLPPDAVDVNVHPQKLEVRFARPQEVHAAVRHVLRRTVLRSPWQRPAATGYAPRAEELLPAAGDARPSYGVEERARPPEREQPVLPFTPAPMRTEDRRPPFYSAMSYLGQLHATYLLCLHEGELVLVDQHAAHERLAFERLRAAYAQKRVRSQRLLFPVSFELDPQRAALVEEYGAALSGMGFELRAFGGRSFALLAAPDAADFGRGGPTHQDAEKLLDKILDDLYGQGGSDALTARTELVLATIACHSVVRAGDHLDEARARALLQAMDEEPFVPHCPHGRPVLVRIPRPEIEKRFGRT